MAEQRIDVIGRGQHTVGRVLAIGRALDRLTLLAVVVLLASGGWLAHQILDQATPTGAADRGRAIQTLHAMLGPDGLAADLAAATRDPLHARERFERNLGAARRAVAVLRSTGSGVPEPGLDTIETTLARAELAARSRSPDLPTQRAIAALASLGSGPDPASGRPVVPTTPALATILAASVAAAMLGLSLAWQRLVLLPSQQLPAHGVVRHPSDGRPPIVEFAAATAPRGLVSEAPAVNDRLPEGGAPEAPGSGHRRAASPESASAGRAPSQGCLPAERPAVRRETAPSGDRWPTGDAEMSGGAPRASRADASVPRGTPRPDAPATWSAARPHAADRPASAPTTEHPVPTDSPVTGRPTLHGDTVVVAVPPPPRRGRSGNPWSRAGDAVAAPSPDAVNEPAVATPTGGATAVTAADPAASPEPLRPSGLDRPAAPSAVEQPVVDACGSAQHDALPETAGPTAPDPAILPAVENDELHRAAAQGDPPSVDAAGKAAGSARAGSLSGGAEPVRLEPTTPQPSPASDPARPAVDGSPAPTGLADAACSDRAHVRSPGDPDPELAMAIEPRPGDAAEPVPPPAAAGVVTLARVLAQTAGAALDRRSEAELVRLLEMLVQRIERRGHEEPSAIAAPGKPARTQG